MKKHSSILDELNAMSNARDTEYSLEANASHIMASICNLTQLIRTTYDDKTADDLIKRLSSSIRSQNIQKFKTGLKNISKKR
jgi:hypothetical protein